MTSSGPAGVVCPDCGSERLVPLTYVLPALGTSAARLDTSLRPQFKCLNCGRRLKRAAAK